LAFFGAGFLPFFWYFLAGTLLLDTLLADLADFPRDFDLGYYCATYLLASLMSISNTTDLLSLLK
jgi:hypothetical protein